MALVAVAAWAGLTKAGYVDNYFGIDFLCPGSMNNNYNIDPFGGVEKKPVIYPYPLEIQDTTVKLDYQGQIIADFPPYDEKLGGWQVVAHPDGHLINQSDGREYSYLFWEGIADKKVNWELTKGFVIKGSDTRKFLQNKLTEIGLTPKEYNEFIVYWYPQMKDNKYNLIHFAGKEYADTAPLEITPKPDSMLRVFMVFKPLQEKIDIPEQKFEKFKRKGFTVIEWGGSEI